MNKTVKPLQAFFKKNSRMPSYGELASIYKFKSRNAAYKLAQSFISQGLLSKQGGKLIPTSNMLGGVRVLGQIEAGFPSPAEEELVDTITIDEYLIENQEATYMLKVKGNSMKDAGILEGDMVLVDRSKSPRNGDIVIAEIDGQWTMKFYIDGKKPHLKAANTDYKDIYPEDELRVAAVVISVVRKY